VCAWQLTAATVTGFIAKENVVGAISVCYVALQGIDLFSAGSDPIIAEQVYNTLGISQVAALSFLMFNLFSPPCFAAIGAMSAEIKSKKWLVAGIVLQLSMGFTVSFLVFFFGTLFTQGSFGQMWMPITGWLIVGMNVLIVSLLVMRNRKKCTI